MSSTTLTSFDDVHKRLLAQLGGNAIALGPISTRVALRTGVSLRSVRPEQMHDTALIAKVVETLADMGYIV